MPEPEAPSPVPIDDAKTERLGMAVTAREKAALAAIASWYPERYDGVSSVLRDYTPKQAVEFVERVTANPVAW